MPQDRPKTAPRQSWRVIFWMSKIVLIFDGFGFDCGPFWLPKRLPFGTPLATKIDQKLDPKSDCSKSHSEITPRPPKTAQRCPPDPPRPSQNTPKSLPGPPRSSQDALPDPRGRPKKFELVEKKSRTKKSTTVIHRGRSHRSLENQKHFQNGRTPKGGGGGRTKRSSIRRPRLQHVAWCESLRTLHVCLVHY